MMGFWDPVISINKPAWRRIEMLVEELYYMKHGEELEGAELRDACQEFIRRIIDEYVRQYFEESAKSAIRLLQSRQGEMEWLD